MYYIKPKCSVLSFLDYLIKAKSLKLQVNILTFFAKFTGGKFNYFSADMLGWWI